MENKAQHCDHGNPLPPWASGAEDTPCMFHGRTYDHHDFTYGNQCRRCGTTRTNS